MLFKLNRSGVLSLALLATAFAPRLNALTLGEPSLVSAPGQPHVIELPLRDMGHIELDQLKARLAPAPAWTAAGLKPVDPARFELSFQRSEIGPVLVVRTPSVADTGFLDILIELQWPNGRLQREMGLPTRAQADGKGPFIAVPTVLWVQPGDTAGALAEAHLDATGQRDQAWAALVQANPNAFVDGNINRLKSGVTLKLPNVAQINAVEPEAARESIARQMQAFAAYRSALIAQAGSAATDTTAPQVATGKVQTRDKMASDAPGDRLNLSTAGSDDSDQIAAKRQAQQSADRAAEINRNIQELNRLAQGGEPAGVPLPAPDSTRPPSESIRQWSSNPLAPWVALAGVLVLLGWTVWRAVRRSNPAAPSAVVESPTTRLEQHWAPDFDLNLPAADDLQPLPEAVHQAPTAVQRSNPTSPLAEPAPSAAGTPLAGLSLELGSPPQASEGLASQDPHAVRLDLARALWQQGQTKTARVLAREVMNSAPPALAQAARSWLDDRA
jgi:pilus assembly protein FimV